ncbi:MAG: pyridoxal phosphate-dependent aminotransferase [Deltaproteobacteria bacterium]|nr:pyridoxal phosphate-dependent aminotransferase [Deltaproteobacteria bacterium]MBI3075609.1 pyridoxal phosphate-dependent aminotransferase [Deltaproteobacteria bacterium]
MQYAERMSRLGTETAFDVLVRAKALEAAGRSVVHLEIGEPDFDTPAHIVEAAVRALREGYTHYGPAAGLPELRAAIAEHVTACRGAAVHPDEVVVTPGAKPIIFFGILACVEPGDEVIYPNPGFPIYESMIEFVRAKAVPLPLREGHQFRCDVDELRKLITPRTRMIILNSPNNPCGSVLPREDLEAIAALALEHDLVVMADEIYSRILYDAKHETIIRVPGMKERTILIDGFSKTYAMTGWRLGYGVVNRTLAGHLVRLMTNSNSCTATFVQQAGIAALRGPQEEPERMVDEFRRRRDLIVAGLNRIPGIRCLQPAGAFYVFPNVQALPLPSQALAHRLLEEAGVATLCGTAFGAHGAGYLRLSYAASLERLEEALGRIAQFVGRL